jgi:hypothetical protein
LFAGADLGEQQLLCASTFGSARLLQQLDLTVSGLLGSAALMLQDDPDDLD